MAMDPAKSIVSMKLFWAPPLTYGLSHPTNRPSGRPKVGRIGVF